MLFELCIDIWRDVFDFLNPSDRKGLAIKCDSIGDREFIELCQKWLHDRKWTKRVRLGQIWVPPPPPTAKWIRHRGERLATVQPVHLKCLDQSDRLWVQAPFAEVELPENIQDFEEITFSHTDTTVLQFLRLLQSLFQDVNINAHVNCKRDDERPLKAAETAIDHLLPLITGGIQSIHLEASSLLFTIGDRWPAQFMSTKQIKVCMSFEDMRGERIDGNGKLSELLLPWLSTRHANGQPRVLLIDAMHCYEGILGFIERIRQHFINATSPASFFIWMKISYRQQAIQESVSTTRNTETGEQLLVRNPRQNILLIGRCSSELDGQNWVEDMDMKIDYEISEQNTTGRQITILYPILGPIIDEARPEEEQVDEYDTDQPGPSSKKPKLI